jgi:SAM-dependent methyltransferase
MAPPPRAARWIVLLAQGDPPHSTGGTTTENPADNALLRQADRQPSMSQTRPQQADRNPHQQPHGGCSTSHTYILPADSACFAGTWSGVVMCALVPAVGDTRNPSGIGTLPAGFAHPIRVRCTVSASTAWVVEGSVDWKEAGRGWGSRAIEWAYLWEPYALPANELLFNRLGVTSGVRLLDIACGSGYAASVAARRGALVSGIDASEPLIAIAATRTPSGKFQAGDMFSLPFPDSSFDVATSFNGIWKGCEGALEEARRVLVPAGHIGVTFWGRFERLGLMPYFLKIIELSPASHGTASVEQGDTQNVIQDMLRATGLEAMERGEVDVVNEWPDVPTAVRALAAAGPAVPAIEAVGYDEFCGNLAEVIGPLYVDGLGVRITSEFGWVTARRR